MTTATDRLKRCLAWSADLHAGQTKKGSKVPYVAHLWGVASLVAEMGGNEEACIAALLHDAAEDQGGEATLALIRAEFGATVEQVVRDCSDTLVKPKPRWRERKERHLAHLEEVDDMALLVMLADKIYNATTIVRDLRSQGLVALDKFNGGRKGTLWYYRQMVDLFGRRMAGRWAGELALVVDEMHRLAAED